MQRFQQTSFPFDELQQTSPPHGKELRGMNHTNTILIFSGGNIATQKTKLMATINAIRSVYDLEHVQLRAVNHGVKRQRRLAHHRSSKVGFDAGWPLQEGVAQPKTCRYPLTPPGSVEQRPIADVDDDQLQIAAVHLGLLQDEDRVKLAEPSLLSDQH